MKTKIKLTNPDEIFGEAQRLVRWHYHWIVIHEFLKKTCGAAVVEDILANGRKHYKWHNEPFIPVEFSVAAYRFGHSQVRPSYRANFTGNPGGQPFFGMIFTPTPSNPNDTDDLSGGHRAPRRFIDWPTFFDFGDGNVRPSKAIDSILSTTMFRLPGSVVPNAAAKSNPASLAQRNLLRHLTFSLPSGQRLAKAMELPLLSKGGSCRPQTLRPRRPHAAVVLRPARGCGSRRRQDARSGRRPDRRRGLYRPPPGQ